MTNAIDKKAAAAVRKVRDRSFIDTGFETAPVGTHDPVENEYTGGTPDEKTIKASPALAYRDYLVDDTTIRRGDRKIIVGGEDARKVSYTPGVGDIVRQPPATGDVWRVVSVEPTKSGDDIAAYTLQVRADG